MGAQWPTHQTCRSRVEPRVEISEPLDQALDDERSIRALVDRWMKASVENDLDTVLGLMTDDVVFEVPGKEPFGKEGFAANSRARGNARVEGTSDIAELQVNGDWAFLRNHLRVALIGSAGTATHRLSGYTLTLLRKESDGEWRIMRDANLLTPDD
jgi:uncharacterized protein (TIGR02246 family)